MPMKYDMCMRKECKNCIYESKCFKEYDYEYPKSKNTKAKNSRIQSKKKINTRGSRISKIKKKYS